MDEFDVVEPAASALIESMRAFGYTPETAIADLIDNSISAGAKNVWLYFYWSGNKSYITIQDDGNGMPEDELVAAMRPGSQHPLEDRELGDLGRFGLGLKTASFSQCRRLTVASKTCSSPMAVRRWDLDYIAGIDRRSQDSGWRLLKSAAPDSELHLSPLKELDSGTIVLWEVLDRIVGDAQVGDSSAQDRFYATVRTVEEHLAMVFHRYLEEPRPRLSIFINGSDPEHRIRDWDPFLRGHSATWSTPTEPIAIGDEQISLQGFVLPHKDKLGEEAHKAAAGPRGWNAQQGFYVYRNERMVVAGNWLGLGRPRSWTKEEHYKLGRILVDIPNSMDGEWQIDVKKSTARPPARIRQRLKDLADVVRRQAREVFAHRGSYGARRQSGGIEHLWKSRSRDGSTKYQIDRDHALIQNLKANAHGLARDLEVLLKLLEETVPVQQIWLDTAESPDTHAKPFEGENDRAVFEVMSSVFRSLQSVEGLSAEQACDRLSGMLPFRDHLHLVAVLLESQE